MELSEKNGTQKEEIKHLNELMKITNKMTFRDQLYYMDGDSEPFCPRCWDSEKKRFIFIEMEPVTIIVIIVITIITMMNIEKGREEHPILVDNYFFVLKGKISRNIH